MNRVRTRGRRGVPRDHGNGARDKAGLDQQPLLTPPAEPSVLERYILKGLRDGGAPLCGS